MSNNASNKIIKAIVSGDSTRMNALQAAPESQMPTFVPLDDLEKWLFEVHPEDAKTVLDDFYENFPKGGEPALSDLTLNLFCEYLKVTGFA